MRNISIASIIAGLMVAVWAGFQIIRAVTHPRKKIIRPVAVMAPSEITSKAVASKDDAGSLQQPMKVRSCDLAGDIYSGAVLCGYGEVFGTGAEQHQLEKQAAEPWKASSGMKEQSPVVRKSTESARPVKQVARSSSDISIKKDKRAAIQGDTVRISSPSKDELQAAIALLKQQDLGVELKFDNFRSN